jgi:hypothetical protein
MSTINGLPAHVLLVHAVVVLIPLSAVLVVVVAVSPRARRRLDILTAVLAVAALLSVPLTTDAGEWLEHRVPRTPLLRAHAELGDYMLPWAFGLALVAVIVAAKQRWWDRRAARAGAAGEPANLEIHDFGPHPRGGRHARFTDIAVAVLAVVIAVGSVGTVYRIGDSGARAAWSGQFSQQPLPRAARPPSSDSN